MTMTAEETPAMLRDRIARLEANLATERQLLAMQNELTAEITTHADALRDTLMRALEDDVSPLEAERVVDAYDNFIREA